MEEKTVCGIVYLVGAGPSDPGLFTLRGKRLIETADVVVYDALIGQGILAMIPDEAEKIYVGKCSGRHTMPQDGINALLLKKAQKGNRVVRLKGGDPFLFGRGGEEMEYLLARGIPCEVVPGVTSALAVPAYQGIPVTHREVSSSVHILTGHRRDGEKEDIDFAALAKLNGTLVFLMGAASLPDICRGLVEGGMSPETPAACLMQGTTAGQRRVDATLQTLDQNVRRQGLMTPAIIVVGNVCVLSERLDRHTKGPLSGKKVLLTRPKALIGESAEKLRALGAEVVEYPTIRAVRREDNTALWEALGRLNAYRWLVFTSPMGVRFFFAEMQLLHMDVRALAGLSIAAIGNGTRQELKKQGLYADLVPDIFDGRHLGEALRDAIQAQRKEGETAPVRILLPRAAAGNRELTEILENEAGIIVDDIATYDTVYMTPEEADNLRGELLRGDVDWVFFTSSSSVRGLVHACQTEYNALPETLPDEQPTLSQIHAVCIGEQTANTARAYGMETITAAEASIDSMILAIR